MPTVEQIQAATQDFIASTPEMAAYLTEENIAQIGAYVQGAFPDAVASPSAYEIAFRDLLSKGKLKRIPGYVAPLTAEQRARVANTPGYIARDLYKTDPEFRRLFDAIAVEEKDRQDLLKWAKDYRWMSENDPTETARRYVEEPGFADAVTALINAGLI